MTTLETFLWSANGYTCVNSSNREPFDIRWSPLTQKLPDTKRSTSCGIYNSWLYSIGSDADANISILSTNYLNNTYNDRMLWDVSQWESDADYGSISQILSQESSTIVDNKMYIVDARYTLATMLIYDMENQTQVPGSEYDYQVPVEPTIFIPCESLEINSYVQFMFCVRVLFYIFFFSHNTQKTFLFFFFAIGCVPFWLGVVNNETHIFMIGGFTYSNENQNTLKIYSILQDTWTNGTNMHYAHGYSTCQYSNYSNKIYVFGGYQQSVIESYDVSLGSWQVLSDTIDDFAGGTASFLVDDYIYILGGSTSSNQRTNRVLVFDIVTETMISQSDAKNVYDLNLTLPVNISELCVITDEEEQLVYTVGGHDSSNIDIIYKGQLMCYIGTSNGIDMDINVTSNHTNVSTTYISTTPIISTTSTTSATLTTSNVSTQIHFTTTNFVESTLTSTDSSSSSNSNTNESTQAVVITVTILAVIVVIAIVSFVVCKHWGHDQMKQHGQKAIEFLNLNNRSRVASDVSVDQVTASVPSAASNGAAQLEINTITPTPATAVNTLSTRSEDHKKNVAVIRTRNRSDKFEFGNIIQLESFLSQLLNDNNINWVLCILKLNGLSQLNNTGNHNKGDNALASLRSNVSKLCSQNTNKFRAFIDPQGGNNKIFVLIHSKRKAEFGLEQIKLLVADIDNSEYCISGGITGIFKTDARTNHTMITNRALASLNIATEKVKQSVSDHDACDGELINYKGKSVIQWNEFDFQMHKTHLQEGKNVFLAARENASKIEQQDKYKKKLDEIANKGNTNWVLAAMDGDNFGAIGETSKLKIEYVINILSGQVQEIANKYSDICLGYQRGGDEFSLIIYCGNDSGGINKSVAQDITNELMSNINKIGQFTISGGLTQLHEEETGRQWENRAEKGLQQAKKNGKNQFCWETQE